MKDPDPDDPMELVGVELPADPEATRDMAYVFAEEFARAGMDGEAILGLFRTPFYVGAHRAYRALGDAAVRGIIAECIEVWGRAIGRVQEGASACDDARHWLPWPSGSRTGSSLNQAGGRTPAGRGRE
jgi:hypothetical protein